MPRDELRAASEALDVAAEAADDDATQTRLREQADQLARLADRSTGPDHGRLARHQHVLADVLADAEGEVAEAVERAASHVSAYRETVEGV